MNDRRIPHTGRRPDELRPLDFGRGAAPYAEGSCLVSMGNTRVLCTATVEEATSAWRQGSGEGWVTAEYAMLPRATPERNQRERQVRGRSHEIQRLIGRSLRACVDLAALEGRTIRIDCDVLQADGGTRTASISGSSIALYDACRWLQQQANLPRSPFVDFAAAVSVGLFNGRVLLDLEYAEDSRAEVDMNVVALGSRGLVEVQGTGERGTFSRAQLSEMLSIAERGIQQIYAAQRAIVAV